MKNWFIIRKAPRAVTGAENVLTYVRRLNKLTLNVQNVMAIKLPPTAAPVLTILCSSGCDISVRTINIVVTFFASVRFKQKASMKNRILFFHYYRKLSKILDK